MIKVTGSVAGASLLAGCGGDGGGGGNGGNGGSGGNNGSGGDGSEDTPTPEPEDYQADIGQVGFDVASIPHTAAVRDMLPEATNDRFQGTIRNFSSGTLQLQSLVSGEIQFYTSAPGNPYNAQVAGNDLRILATKISGTDYIIVVREEVDGFQDFAESDLSFGISSPGALSHIQPVGVFEQEGIDKDQVNFVNIGGSSERTQSLAAGNIDGAALHLGQFEQLQSQDAGVKSLGRVTDYFPNFVQECVVTTAEFLEDPLQEEFAQEYINQLYRANQRANEDPDWLFEKTQQYQAESLNREEFDSTYELNKNELGAWVTEPINPEGYQGVLTMMDEGGLIDAEEIDLDTMIAQEYSQNAADNL